ncbi:hypothetical protein EVAR_11597_1 [Eumeta japonica]|uniref:Uncharacterized protein n=1 Tax=Eumeta variegata TaxID=151549 RepID=A0A4C1X7S6_EUMVA|nr:hypothetical protein EVAR_11597_1 [Eumeta japonica]
MGGVTRLRRPHSTPRADRFFVCFERVAPDTTCRTSGMSRALGGARPSSPGAGHVPARVLRARTTLYLLYLR